MFSEVTLLNALPSDEPKGETEWSVYKQIEKDIINILSENKFTISQTRCMFNNILSQFERNMPVTNHYK